MKRLSGGGVVWCWSLVGLAVTSSGADSVGRPPPIRVELTADRSHDLELNVLPGGGYELRTTGSDPYVFSTPLAALPNTSEHVILSFEYFCVSGLDSFQVFFGPVLSEARSQKGPGPGVSEAWTTYTLDLSQSKAWSGDIPFIRLDPGRQPDNTLRIRNIQLRGPTEREREIIAARAARQEASVRRERQLGEYVTREFPCAITRVTVSEDAIDIDYDLNGVGADDVILCEVPVYQHLLELANPVYSQAVKAGGGTERLPRYRSEQEGQYDRLLSRWALARRTGDALQWLSPARYADDRLVHARRQLPVPAPRSKKGLGGFGVGRHDNGADADSLGIGYVTVNMVLSFMRPGPGVDVLPFTYCGRTYYVHEPTIERYDRTLTFCADRRIVVSAILLIPKAGGFAGDLGRIFMHPDCDPSAIFSMANVTSREGLQYYAAAVDFLARRYSRPDQRYGRIHHWIVHNEVDAGWVWTNAGEKPLREYVDLYHKSLRTVHLIARSYDARARAFVSLTHHWTWAYDARFYVSRDVLECLAESAALEGDFEWGLAYHPYPESLRDPRCWEDERVTLDFDTPMITFKNIEVLDAWMKLPRMRYRGQTVRTIHLSEQGANSPDYSEASLRDQAACMAYAWKKIAPLDTIEAFHYHNWIDNAHEGGLLLGLRKLPGPEHNCEPKPIWHVFRKLDTPAEEEACAFAKGVIGIDTWEEVRFEGRIAEESDGHDD